MSTFCCELSDNTILVFTTDHATYKDNDYTGAIAQSVTSQNEIDEIPLMIYYKGITSEPLDVGGRNSLDLAPTILDYVDLSEPNYFLGTSLFAPKQNNNSYDTIFAMESASLDSDGKIVNEISDAKRGIVDVQLQKYFTAKTQRPETK